ncbi:MAG: glycosyltransferase 36 [Balneolaceae bacterium]|nr:glycosyltransferase 36 [Balneolaceae bacterium]
MSENPDVSFDTGMLRQSAASLAELHASIGQGDKIEQIEPILFRSRDELVHAYRILTGMAKSDREISPGGEWLIDNFYIIQEQIVQTEIDFPKEYQVSIPICASGDYEGLPRVYELALNYLTNTDNVLDMDVLLEYIKSYQQIETLTQGEIWAIPIMIRLILIEKLAQKASKVVDRKLIKLEAEKFIAQIEKGEYNEPGSIVNELSVKFNTLTADPNYSFWLVEMFNQMQSSGLMSDQEKRWFSYRFRQIDTTFSEALHIEVQKYSRLQVSIRNAVISLRFTAETDWADFVEECSVIEKILRLDPTGHYPEMDFQTRDSYRRVVERLSRRSDYSESEIAEQVLMMVEEQSHHVYVIPEERLFNRDYTRQHVGWFLVGDGYRELTDKVKYRMPIKEQISRQFEKHSGWYLAMIIAQTVLLMVIIWLATNSMGGTFGGGLAVLLVSLFPALDLSVSSVNRFLAFLLPPRILPKMEYKDGIPDLARTMVVVPTILTSVDDVLKQVELLEVRSLANSESSLQFCLLSDFKDSSKKEEKGDTSILKSAMKAIRELNKKYSSRYGNRFYLLHRERLWNENEKVWMGWERKRGKLEEFNRLLLSPDNETSYKYIEGDFFDSVKLLQVQYVLTLDADTKLPPMSARNLIRTISHPLNRAWLNKDSKRVERGYGVIQPRISISPESAGKTWFAKIFSGNVGLDPYSTAVSDIYQDLAGEAIFTGKGIYDVQVFHEVLENRFPENRILSHDLIESAYVRAGLATDIELFDDYPSTYVNFSKRNHRWTRGDWQIAAWLFRKVPGREKKEHNPITLLSRWKIFDNLRRSLNPLFLTIFFIAGWFLLPGSAWIWTAAAFGILAFPIYVSLSSDILNRPARVRWKLYLDKVRANLKLNTIQALFTVISIPHQAVLHLDAIVRTLYRLKVSGRNLLQWTTASLIEDLAPNTFGSYVKSNLISVILGAGILIAGVTTAPGYLWIVAPFAILWGGAPLWFWLIGRQIKTKDYELSDDQVQLLRGYARKTWFYFERLVNEEHFWLPPDNHQEDPSIPVAERTSPTNIGLSLVSAQTAYNMGYITQGELVDRLFRTLNSVNQLEKFRGHLYNWYETRLGEVLSPKYISTVDSGNLAACLVVVKQFSAGLLRERGMNKHFRSGLNDTVKIVQQLFDEYGDLELMPEVSLKKIKYLTGQISDKLSDDTDEGEEEELLRYLKSSTAELCSVDLMPLGSKLSDDQMQDLLFWLESPLRMVESYINECKLMPLSDHFEGDYSITDLISLLSDEEEYSSTLAELKCRKVLIEEIAKMSEMMLEEMDFSFLYLEHRGLFSIGYNVEKASLDEGTYDLLASEARIASYVAIAKGDVPSEHWFRLSRRLTNISGNEILLSWGGTMFEYLMPLLFMRDFRETLLDHTSRNVVDWQQTYARKSNRPWGFSESAYNILNLDLHYQYRTFGAPGLGLKRGLAEEYVVAPYASMLALMVDPESAIENLKLLEKIGASGLYGFYDSVDFTPHHLKDDQEYHIVKTYMVHHHGMGLLAIENLLHEGAVQSCFHSDPAVKGCELILQEKVPRGVPVKEPHPIDVELEPGEQSSVTDLVEHAGIQDLDVSPPRLQILSNGKYSVALSHTGTGASRCNGLMLNAWEPDPVTDQNGLFFYIRDMESNNYWSAMHQPVRRKPDRYDTWFHNGKIVTSRVDDWIETTSTVTVSPDHNMEIRKITLTNYSQEERQLEITSFAEVVLNGEADHRSHPAFSKLFVQTDYLAENHAILVKRRPRSEHEPTHWMVHSLAEEEQDNLTEPLQFETDRAKFIGRGRTYSDPLAMDRGRTLQGTFGNVSDPIVSLRKCIRLKPGEKKELIFGMGYSKSREEAELLAAIFNNRHSAERAFELSSVYSQVELNHFGITSKQAHYFQKLASYILYSDPKFRGDSKELQSNRKAQKDLWAYGISGDMPLIVFRLNETAQLRHVSKLLKAHAFWKMKGIETELLFINDHAPGYIDEVQEAIMHEIEKSGERELLNSRGGLFMYRSDRIQRDDLTLILTVAHAVFIHSLPDFSKPVKKQTDTDSWNQSLEKGEEEPREQLSELEWNEELQFHNGYGGFNKEGTEYLINVMPDRESGKLNFPPAPWINVISNPRFGFTATERGSGYIWCDNSRENKITGWSNDPVLDTHSAAFYFRNEKNFDSWSPTPGPKPGTGIYQVRHGFGYTEYHHKNREFSSCLTEFVPKEDTAKVSMLSIKNSGDKALKLSLFHYQERVMGVERHRSSRFITQQLCDDEKSIYSVNHYNNEFSGRVVFASPVTTPPESGVHFSTDRRRFIGRNRSLADPAALEEATLGNELGTGGDPCVAYQVTFNLAPGESTEICFLTGEADSSEKVDELIRKYGEPGIAGNELEMVKEFWKRGLGRVQVSVPEPSMNLLMNGWLMYQNISCRMWARTAFYQAGGAYGFRDQLQDSMAAIYFNPDITRNQILLHSENQFPEGDALHWWHPPTGRGIRSKITDDRLWLPFVTHFYISSTGDWNILDEETEYISARSLTEEEHEVYLQPDRSTQSGSIYEHCCRAIDISLKFGRHMLPLIGAGDWNDGMNRVGEKGEGESVWLGFFLFMVLEQFSDIATSRGDDKRAERYSEHALHLKERLNRSGWDGKWYLRAFYDDGTPLGSASNSECRIDAISQSWASISGVASDDRARQAIEAAEEHLVSYQDGIIRLLNPPFDRTEKDPGYIKGYIPGVRENGGQYTHGALWLIKAMAEMGEGEKAVRAFNMINPVNLTSNPQRAERYKAEPYVVAADVYGEPPLTGMAGWSWYTGSGGWMYRVALESILGFSFTDRGFKLKPSISSDWKEYSLTVYPDDEGTEYHIKVVNPDGVEKGRFTGVVNGDEVKDRDGTLWFEELKKGEVHKIEVKLHGTVELHK